MVACMKLNILLGISLRRLAEKQISPCGVQGEM